MRAEISSIGKKDVSITGAGIKNFFLSGKRTIRAAVNGGVAIRFSLLYNISHENKEIKAIFL